MNYRRLNLKTDLKPRPRSLSDDRMNSNEDELCHYAALLPSETNNDRLVSQNIKQMSQKMSEKLSQNIVPTIF